MYITYDIYTYGYLYTYVQLYTYIRDTWCDLLPRLGSKSTLPAWLFKGRKGRSRTTLRRGAATTDRGSAAISK